MEKVKLRLKLLVSYLDNGDVKKAKENYLQIAEHLGDAEFNKGYSKAINGIVTSIEKMIGILLFIKLFQKKLTKEI